MDLICQMKYGLQYHITLDAKSNSADTVQKNPGKNVLSQMIKTVSIRKLNDFNFQWTKTFFSEYFKPYRIPFYTFQGLQMYRNSRKSSIKPPGGAYFFSSTFSEGFIEGGGGLIQFSEMHQREQGFSTTDLWFPGVILLFLTIRTWYQQSVKLKTLST